MLQKIKASITRTETGISLNFPKVNAFEKLRASDDLVICAMAAFAEDLKEIECVVFTGVSVELMDMPNFNIVGTACSIREIKAMASML